MVYEKRGTNDDDLAHTISSQRSTFEQITGRVEASRFEAYVLLTAVCR